MFDFILMQYKMGHINETQSEQFAAQEWITETEANQIISTA